MKWNYFWAGAGILLLIGVFYWHGSSGTQFLSRDLGITFTLPTKEWTVTQRGNKVYVYPPEGSVEEGQFVEVFTKNPDEPFQGAIRRIALKEYPWSECKIEISNNSTLILGFTTAEITSPPPANPEEFYYINADKCNPNYAQTNGLRYFAYDPNYPDRFFFLSIGQYIIETPSGEPWQQTFRVLPLSR